MGGSGSGITESSFGEVEGGYADVGVVHAGATGALHDVATTLCLAVDGLEQHLDSDASSTEIASISSVEPCLDDLADSERELSDALRAAANKLNVIKVSPIPLVGKLGSSG